MFSRDCYNIINKLRIIITYTEPDKFGNYLCYESDYKKRVMSITLCKDKERIAVSTTPKLFFNSIFTT